VADPLCEAPDGVLFRICKIPGLAILECALDRYYYADALATVRDPTYNNNLIRNLLSLEVDVVNVRTVLRMVRDHVDPADAQRYLIGAEGI